MKKDKNNKFEKIILKSFKIKNKYFIVI